MAVDRLKSYQASQVEGDTKVPLAPRMFQTVIFVNFTKGSNT